MSLKLYEIDAQLRALYEQIVDADGVLDAETEAALAISEAALQQKAVAYGFVIKTAEAEIESIDGEIKRLLGLAASRKKSIAYLKTTIGEAMWRFGITKVQSPTLTLSFRGSEAVVILNEGEVPEEFKTRETVVSIDKAKIKASLKAEREVPGAFLDKRQNLQIK